MMSKIGGPSDRRRDWAVHKEKLQGGKARRRRFWATFTILILGATSIVGYAFLSLMTNAQASTSAFPGWAALLQPQTEQSRTGGAILFEVAASPPGAQGSRPHVVYSVLACGDKPFHGVLLLGGQARLDDLDVIQQDLSPAAVSNVPDLALRPQSGDPDLDLGPVQQIQIAINEPTPCAGPAGSDQQLMSLTGSHVTGLAQGPIQRRVDFLGFEGPHTSQAWPLIGGLPTARPGMLGVFIGVRGLAGSWSIPSTLHMRVSSGSLTPRASVDGATPPLADASKVVWDSQTAIRATARITNIEDLDQWQDWLVAGGIIFGIGASLLATLLFEWLRPAREGVGPIPDIRGTYAEAVAPLTARSGEPFAKRASARAAAPVALAALAVVAYVLRRRGR